MAATLGLWLGLGAPGSQAAGAGPTSIAVRDESGAAIVGAELAEGATLGDGRPVADDRAPALFVADARGLFAPVPLPSRPDRVLLVRAPGRATALVPDAAGPAVVVLPKALAIDGYLRREDGGPPRDALVLAWPAGTGRGLVHRAWPDEGGRYAFAALGPGRWRIEARRPGGVRQELGTVLGGEHVPPAVLRAGSRLEGRLIDADLGGAARPTSVVLLRLVDGGTRDLAASLFPAPVSDPAPAGRPPVLEPPGGSPAPTPTMGAPPAAPQGAPPAAPAPTPSTPAQDPHLEAVSDAAGHLAFQDVPPGIYEATLPDPLLAWDGPPPRLEVDAVGNVRLPSWWLRRRGTIVGVARDAKTRAPLADVRIQVVPAPDAPPFPGARVLDAEVTTGPDGVFRVRGIAPGEGYRVVATAAGRSAVVLGPFAVPSARVTDVQDVLLWRGWTAAVEVVGPEGKPVASASLVATPASRPHPVVADEVAQALARTATTDAEGRATIPDVPDGDAVVVVRAEGFLEGRLLVAQPGAGVTRSVRIGLARLERLVGRVAWPEGRPPPLLVRATARSTGAARLATPGADGTFEVGGLAPGPTDVEVLVDGASSSLVLARREGVLPGSGEPLVLEVPPPRVVAGEAEGLRIDGGPAVARLELRRFDPDRDELRPVVAEEVVLARGGTRAAFRFVLVPPGPCAVRVVQGQRDSSPVAVPAETGSVTTLRVVVPFGAGLEGEVVDGRRLAPALGARVTLTRLEGRDPGPGAVADRPSTVTDERGRYRFIDVAPGVWSVEASDRDAASARQVVRVVEGEAGWVAPLVLSDGGRIEGSLSDGAGRPVAGVPVRIFRLPDEEEQAPALSGEDGRFRTAPLAAGRYRVRAVTRAASTDGVEAEVDVVEGEPIRVDLRADGGATVSGVVRRRATLVAGVEVEMGAEAVRGCEALVRRATTDALGAFAFEGVPEGSYTLRLVDGAVTSATAVHVASGDRIHRDLELGEGRISGRVRTASGEPVRGAEVVAVPEGAPEEAGVGHARTGPDGSYAISGLGLGRFRLLVTPLARTTRVVPGVFAELAGREPPTDVVIGAGARLDLVVRDDRRRGVPGAEVWIEDPTGVALHPRAFVTGGGGRLLVEGLVEGPARLRVKARGLGRPRLVPVVLKDGLVTASEVILAPSGSLRVIVAAGRDPRARARIDLLREPGGEPLEHRRTLRRPDDVSGFGVTPRTGVLVLDDLEEGTYTVVVDAGREFEPARVLVRVRPREVEDVSISLRFKER